MPNSPCPNVNIHSDPMGFTYIIRKSTALRLFSKLVSIHLTPQEMAKMLVSATKEGG